MTCGDGDVRTARTPMQKAPPKSLSATHGQGSLEWSITECACAIVNYRMRSPKGLIGGGRCGGEGDDLIEDEVLQSVQS